MLVGATELFEFDDARLVPDLPGNDLPGVLAVVCFDDRPAAMRAIMTAPFKMMQIARRVDFLDDCIAVMGFVRGFYQVTVHRLSGKIQVNQG